MADPLSIAASVAGLLATSGKICSALSTFISGVVDAPQSARDVLTTVEEMRAALEMVQGLIDALSTLPSQRRVLLRLDLITITFSSCVLTMSELESMVSSCFKDGVMHRLRWAWAEKKILKLLPRLESQKASLSLMVTTLVCQSNLEAIESRDKLCNAVELILQRDEEFAARMRQIDLHSVDDRSVRFYEDSVLDSRRVSVYTTLAGMSRGSTSGPSAQQLTSRLREFETVLETSRVYARTQSNDSDISVTSSAVRSHAWSHLSLNNISVISVFRLPVTLDDIAKFGPGLTFSSMLECQQDSDAIPSIAEPQLSNENKQSYTAGSSETGAWLPQSLPSSSSTRPGQPNPVDPDTSGSLETKGHAFINGGACKLVVVGDHETMKTAMLISYAHKALPSEYVPTVFDNYSVTITVDKIKYSLGLWDTAGQESYSPRLRSLSYPQTDVFLVLARIGLPATFHNVKRLWIPEITESCPRVPFIVVGIRSNDEEELLQKAWLQKHPDKPHQYTKMGQEIADEFGAVKYVECNIHTQQDLKNVFDEAIRAAIFPPVARRGRKRTWNPRFLGRLGETKEED
ncbi:P-loop containing nucleoside triphosphate hydrolase protein [Podospora aff. communis PSN243]|uniref:P-loop containing nucleoside triphosphate hydrolase protein n=1 Tax=Podospora aff. communis PSN243 TaxID=3040156 RepID=A0AAV9G8X9_9PEZI|nr:P-loop containing nucleoside triphosphate hydrolase protein [Podospora aff. communis PSN243]